VVAVAADAARDLRAQGARQPRYRHRSDLAAIAWCSTSAAKSTRSRRGFCPTRENNSDDERRRTTITVKEWSSEALGEDPKALAAPLLHCFMVIVDERR
jgi:hypothetical protein